MTNKNDKMLHVSKENLCPVCHKHDWCLVAEDRTAAICPRIEEGSKKRCGDAGWLHILSNRHNRHNGHKKQVRRHLLSVSIEPPLKDFERLTHLYRQQLTSEKLNFLATNLGVSPVSLQRLRAGWDGKAYTFPMSDVNGNVIGIRRRFPDGHKVSLTGSKTGLFIPDDLPGDTTLLICEGPTDTCAALDLGFDAIGRPNCNSKVDMTAKFVKGRDVVIVGDNDESGRSGAERLSAVLILYCKSVRNTYPSEHIKDLRDWVSIGLTADKLKGIISDTEPIEIKVHFKSIS